MQYYANILLLIQSMINDIKLGPRASPLWRYCHWLEWQIICLICRKVNNNDSIVKLTIITPL